MFGARVAWGPLARAMPGEPAGGTESLGEPAYQCPSVRLAITMTSNSPEPLDQLREQAKRDYAAAAPVTIAERVSDLASRRATCPISFSERGGGYWVLTTYDDISSVLRKNNHGVVSYPSNPEPESTG